MIISKEDRCVEIIKFILEQENISYDDISIKSEEDEVDYHINLGTNPDGSMIGASFSDDYFNQVLVFIDDNNLDLNQKSHYQLFKINFSDWWFFNFEEVFRYYMY